MPDFEPRDPDFAEHVRTSFGRQRLMQHLGARLAVVEPGRVEIELPFSEALTQQHGFLHAGAVTSCADSAGGYAAYTLMPPGSSILTVEFKVNFLSPLAGERFRAVGRVVRPGRTLTFTELEVLAVRADGAEKRCLTGQQTAMRVEFGADGPAPG